MLSERAVKWCCVMVGAWAVWSTPLPVAWGASLLPLVTEQAETLPSGTAEAILGVAYFNNMRYPAFTPPGSLRSQQLVGLPQVGFRIGAGAWAEIQASYEVLYLDETTSSGQTNWQYGSGDMRMFTKAWFVRERDQFPALGLRFGTKLPNASRSSGLGTDDTDFGADVLASKDMGQLSLHANLGLLLLGNSGPMIGNSFTAGGQDDLFNYGLAAVSSPLGAVAAGATTLRLMAELTGQTGSRSGFGNDRSALRAGLQLNRGAGTLYLGVSAGLITGSENIGASTGFIYTFEPARLFVGE
jgi:hypothetical protein